MSFTMHASEAAIARMFPDSADIETPTDTQDEEGGISEQTWATTFADIPVQISPRGGGGSVANSEVRNANGDFVKASHLCYCRGDHDISERDRCVVLDEVFDVVSVDHDSYRLVTVLHLERREPTDDAS